MIKKAFIFIIEKLIDHPKLSGVLGGIQAFVVGLINIETTILWLKLVGEALKVIGIAAGTCVALYGFYNTFFKPNIKKGE